jgi:hypothetical protein
MNGSHYGQRVYLSGGMEYAANEGRDWRQQMQEWLQSEMRSAVFNPNVESKRFFESHAPDVDFRALKGSDPERFQELVSHLVDIDCMEIAEHSDYIICYWDDGAMRGAGTKGELTMARFFGKPVYMVTAIPFAEIPGWVLGCTSKLFPDFDTLKAFLSAS